MVNTFFIRFFDALMGNIFVLLLIITVCADMVFGSLRAAKYRAWNSAVGIDGAIRKAGMLASVHYIKGDFVYCPVLLVLFTHPGRGIF